MINGLLLSSHAQAPGALKTEAHPPLTVSTCTTKGGCTPATKSVVIDSNWRWTHEDGKPQNCYTSNKCASHRAVAPRRGSRLRPPPRRWDKTLCSDVATCSKNCVIEGADAEYENTYGVTASGKDLKLNFVTQGPSSKNIGSRTYLLDVPPTAARTALSPPLSLPLHLSWVPIPTRRRRRTRTTT